MGSVESVRLVAEKKGPALRFYQVFKEKTQKLINEVYENKVDKEKYVPPIQIVILNRGFDMLSPFMNDMTYSGLYYSMMKQTKNRLEYELELENQGFIKKTSYLNETDAIWRNSKFQPFTENFVKLSSSFKNFLKEYSTVKQG